MAGIPKTFTHVFIGFLITVISGLRASSLQQVFVKDIVAVYGENGSLDLNGINSLLETIVQDKLDPNIPLHAQCVSGEDILVHYGLQNLSHLTEEHLVTVCPALLNQALLPPCSTEPPVHSDTDLHVWGFGFLAVTIINLASLLGLTLIPVTKKPYFPKVLTYFIGLAVGTLFSNAALQLIPEAFGFDPKADGYVLQAVGIFGGFYALYVTEKILRIVLKPEHEGHGHSHFQPTEGIQQNGAINTVDSDFNFASSDKASITSDPSVEQGSCRWLRGGRLASVKTVAWMISLSDALHNFIDGLAIGASFTVSVLSGFSTSIAIVCEEFPHELGDFIILLNAGLSVPQAVFFNLLSAMSCYLGLVLGILLGSTFAPSIIFAFAGGMFLYIALADMLPEMNMIASEQVQSTKADIIFFAIQNAGMLTGFAMILLITLYGGNISLG
ncbi:zinc transporter ZIP8 isoform X2 [Sinocyclocheilus anshuiensis]|uniref:zinc transporter ZIP8 isoform X2 n=1 Tax=Sinocyclocheilus anshuiensis TaxID=1608454 RepID=UPI0007B8F038|nr:PREDICTED: zinc transporter ZIP8-like isoform X2 [Sinocyclocheilus anshuiensis]